MTYDKLLMDGFNNICLAIILVTFYSNIHFIHKQLVKAVRRDRRANNDPNESVYIGRYASGHSMSRVKNFSEQFIRVN